MNENGNKYALAALKDKRASIAGEIAHLKGVITRRQKHLEHVDETIRIFEPDFDLDSIPLKRPKGHVKLFRQGELGRLIIGALRRAGEPLSTRDIVTAVMDAKGDNEDARPALAPRVRGNLAYHQRQGTITKVGSGTSVTWMLRL